MHLSAQIWIFRFECTLCKWSNQPFVWISNKRFIEVKPQCVNGLIIYILTQSYYINKLYSWLFSEILVPLVILTYMQPFELLYCRYRFMCGAMLNFHQPDSAMFLSFIIAEVWTMSLLLYKYTNDLPSLVFCHTPVALLTACTLSDCLTFFSKDKATGKTICF